MNNGTCIPEYLIIEDVEIPIVLERSKRKTLAIGITQEGALKVKAPFSLSETEIIRFVKQKSFWIYKQVKKVEENRANMVTYSREEERSYREKARAILTDKTAYYGRLIGVTYNRIRVADQKTRWGSCSSRGTISYNWHLILLPENILDYVVVHELCHLLEMNHSPRFWSQVEKILPDYRERRNWLKKKGGAYLQTKTEE